VSVDRKIFFAFWFLGKDVGGGSKVCLALLVRHTVHFLRNLGFDFSKIFYTIKTLDMFKVPAN
jgi:hypothetical protein